MSRHDTAIGGNGPTAMAVRDQMGALCWRMRGSRPEVLLITSRDTGRWVIPKGWPIADLTAADAAAREAWEEAGVAGQIAAEPLGYFAYRKGLTLQTTVPCIVRVFALRVDRLADRFPERSERRRKWFRAEKAAKKVAEPDLRALILGFSPDEMTSGPR